MRLRSFLQKLRDSGGQSMVEFSLSVLMLVLLLLGVFEIGRMVLVYTTIANAARVGTRYAEVHGTDSPVTEAQVQAVVKNYLSAAPMATGNALISPVWSAGSAAAATIGSTVTVTVNYKYDPFMTYFPLGVYLASTSQGVIAF